MPSFVLLFYEKFDFFTNICYNYNRKTLGDNYVDRFYYLFNISNSMFSSLNNSLLYV